MGCMGMDYFKKKNLVIELFGILFLSILIFCIFGNLLVGDVNMIDEGQFAAWANHMLLGKLMYKDIYITYGPLYVYPLYIALKFFGPSAFAVRIYLMLGTLIGIFVCNLLLQKVAIHKFIRYFTILLIIILPVMQLRQAIGLLSFYFLTNFITSKKIKWMFLSGVTNSLALFVSPEIGLFVFCISFLFMLSNIVIGKPFKHALLSFLIWIVGILGICLFFLAWAGEEGWLHR